MYILMKKIIIKYNQDIKRIQSLISSLILEVVRIMNPAFLLGTAFNIAYWHRKYHSGTICKGVTNPQTSNALSGCEKEEIPKWVWRRYRQLIIRKPKKSFMRMNGKNGILLFVFNLKGLLEEWKWR